MQWAPYPSPDDTDRERKSTCELTQEAWGTTLRAGTPFCVWAYVLGKLLGSLQAHCSVSSTDDANNYSYDELHGTKEREGCLRVRGGMTKSRDGRAKKVFLSDVKEQRSLDKHSGMGWQGGPTWYLGQRELQVGWRGGSSLLASTWVER